MISQSENGQLNTTLQDLQRAESAGANNVEMQGLVDQMNSVANLEAQLQNVPPQDTSQRAQLLGEINTTLTSVDAQAIQLQAVASQRTHLGYVIAYASGIIGAVIGTISYYYGAILYKRYQIIRSSQSKFLPEQPNHIRNKRPSD